jgi:hypothetical protein
MDPWDLLGQIGRHRRPIRLVVGRHLGAERRTSQIERGRDVTGLMILNQLAQHRHEDVHRMRRFAAGTAEPGAAHRVVRAVHL